MSKIEVDAIEPQSGTSLTLGASGDTITIPSGATIDLSSATQTGVGGTNTPFFWSYLGETQPLTSATWTKMNMNTEEKDSDNCYDISTYRFTPTEAGIYCFVGRIAPQGASASIAIKVYKNGSGSFTVKAPHSTYTDASATTHPNMIGFAEANGTSDYFELYGYVTTGTNISGANASGGSAAGLSFWGAYKIII